MVLIIFAIHRLLILRYINYRQPTRIHSKLLQKCKIPALQTDDLMFPAADSNIYHVPT